MWVTLCAQQKLGVLEAILLEARVTRSHRDHLQDWQEHMLVGSARFFPAKESRIRELTTLGSDSEFAIVSLFTPDDRRGRVTTIFMIFRRDGKRFVQEFAEFHRVSDESSTPVLAKFIGECKLDHDRLDEIVVEAGKGELAGAAFLKRTEGKRAIFYRYYYSG